MVFYHLNDIDYRRRHAKLLLSLGKLGRQCGSILVNDQKNSFTLATKFNLPSNSLNIYASVKKQNYENSSITEFQYVSWINQSDLTAPQKGILYFCSQARSGKTDQGSSEVERGRGQARYQVEGGKDQARSSRDKQGQVMFK